MGGDRRVAGERRPSVGGEPGPAPRASAWRAIARCFVRSLAMLARHRVCLPEHDVGRVIRFADGTTARVFRESVADRVPSRPCFLAVSFKLRLVHGPLLHRLFEAESMLNTPLFIGFPGFVSKLWCAHDESGMYRGLYEWDGAARARHYASSLWRILELGCVPGSIRYVVVPGLRRDDVIADPDGTLGAADPEGREWWRPVAAP